MFATAIGSIGFATSWVKRLFSRLMGRHRRPSIAVPVEVDSPCRTLGDGARALRAGGAYASAAERCMNSPVATSRSASCRCARASSDWAPPARCSCTSPAPWPAPGGHRSRTAVQGVFLIGAAHRSVRAEPLLIGKRPHGERGVWRQRACSTGSVVPAQRAPQHRLSCWPSMDLRMSPTMQLAAAWARIYSRISGVTARVSNSICMR